LSAKGIPGITPCSLVIATLSVCLLFAATPAAADIVYFYDELNRLVRVIRDDGEAATYHYDAVGNILRITRESGVPQVLFALFWMVSRWVAFQWPRWAQVTIEVFGWMLILGAAASLTRRWAAPALVLAAGVLMTAGERVADGLINSRSDRDVALGVLLSPLISLAAAGFLIGGIILMVCSLLRDRARDSQGH
jgi:YD repeat-containing protein